MQQRIHTWKYNFTGNRDVLGMPHAYIFFFFMKNSSFFKLNCTSTGFSKKCNNVLSDFSEKNRVQRGTFRSKIFWFTIVIKNEEVLLHSSTLCNLWESHQICITLTIYSTYLRGTKKCSQFPLKCTEKSIPTWKIVVGFLEHPP